MSLAALSAKPAIPRGTVMLGSHSLVVRWPGTTGKPVDGLAGIKPTGPQIASSGNRAGVQISPPALNLFRSEVAKNIDEIPMRCSPAQLAPSAQFCILSQKAIVSLDSQEPFFSKERLLFGSPPQRHTTGNSSAGLYGCCFTFCKR